MENNGKGVKKRPQGRLLPDIQSTQAFFRDYRAQFCSIDELDNDLCCGSASSDPVDSTLEYVFGRAAGGGFSTGELDPWGFDFRGYEHAWLETDPGQAVAGDNGGYGGSAER